MDVLKQLTDLQLVDRAIAALTEIESRRRGAQPGLRLPVIERAVEFRRVVKKLKEHR